MKHLSFEATAVQEMRNAQPPPPPPFFVLLLLSATQLPSYVAFAYLFPCWTAWMAVINRARIIGICGIKLATCCCLRIRISSTYTRRKKDFGRPSRQPHLQPRSSSVVSSSSCRSFSVFSLCRRPMPSRLTLLSRE